MVVFVFSEMWRVLKQQTWLECKVVLRIVSNQVNRRIADHKHHAILFVIKTLLYVLNTNMFPVILILLVSIVGLIKSLVKTIVFVNHKGLCVFSHMESLVLVEIWVLGSNTFPNLSMHQWQSNDLPIDWKYNLFFVRVVKETILKHKIHVSLNSYLFKFHNQNVSSVNKEGGFRIFDKFNVNLLFLNNKVIILLVLKNRLIDWINLQIVSGIKDYNWIMVWKQLKVYDYLIGRKSPYFIRISADLIQCKYSNVFFILTNQIKFVSFFWVCEFLDYFTMRKLLKLLLA